MSNLLSRLLVVGLFSFAINASSAELKIGYVQVDKILQEAPQTAESGKKLEKEFAPRSQELERMQKQIKDIETSIDKDALTMAEADRKNKERDASNLKIDFQRKQRELREDVNLRKNEELGALQDKINKAVTAVSESEGYDLVVYGGVAYANKKIDITDKVLKSLGRSNRLNSSRLNAMGVTLKYLVETLGGQLIGSDIEVERVSSIANAQAGSITFITDSKYQKELIATKASAVILTAKDKIFSDLPSIITDNPYAYFAQVSTILNPKPKTLVGIHKTADVDKATKIPRSCAIGPMAVIGKNVILDDDVIIGPGCFLGDNVSIGKHTKLEPNVTVYSDSIIGENCNISAGSVIGADGFGYASKAGTWVKIPQVGKVIIGNNVDIGSNTTIDRGALDNTIIEEGVKLDNLIQIGHNCLIGAHTVIAGCVGVAGSAKIGRRCKIGGAAMILGHLEIADDVTISPGSMITRSLKISDTYTALMPFQTHENWLRTAANLRHLTDLNEKLKQLEKEIAEIKSKN